MLEDTASFIQSLLGNAWELFKITVPGTSFSFAQMFIGISVIGISIKILQVIFGFGGGGSSSRTDSTDKAKISEERKHDDK